MKKGITALVLLVVLTSFRAERTERPVVICNLIDGYDVTGRIAVANPSAKASNTVSEIVDVVGLKRNFSLLAAGINNAGALMYGSNRVILYNPYFMEVVHKAARNDWTSYSILAHEIGHHLNGHTIRGGGNGPQQELDADEFSGFVLRKLGASLTEAQSAIDLISNEAGSSTHPPKKLRLTSIAKGWYKADQQLRRGM